MIDERTSAHSRVPLNQPSDFERTAMRKYLLIALTVSVIGFGSPTPANAQNEPKQREQKVFKPDVMNAAKHDKSRPLREIPPLAAKKGREYENPMNFVKRPATDQSDGALQSAAVPSVPVINGLNFEG